LVYKTQLKETSPIILPQTLSPGIYLYRIIQETKNDYGKLLIEN